MIRLNKFISNSGLCTRREADDYIVDGRVHVDNQIVTTLGYKVSIDSEIRVDNKIIVPYSFQYVVLNKPVDFNLNSKKNIFDLIKSSEIDNLGLLEMVKDDFKGLVLFSNDNGLNKSFPFNIERIKQLFHITLKKPLTTQKLKYFQEKSIENLKIISINFVNDAKKNEIGLELFTSSHSYIKNLFKDADNEIDNQLDYALNLLTKNKIIK